MDLASVREDVQSLVASRARASFARHAGLAFNAFSADARSAPLAIDPEARALVDEAAGKAQGRRALRLRRLSQAMGRLNYESALGASLEEIRGELQGVLEAMKTTRKREERLRLDAGLRTESLARDWGRRIEGAQGSGLELTREAEEARRMLSQTEAMYADVLAWWLKKSTGLKQDAAWHDLLWAFGTLPFDSAVRRHDLTRLPGAFEPAGFQARLHIDEEPRAGRGEGALVVAAESVLVSHATRGGFEDLGHRLRALGTGWHHAGVDAAAPPEDRLLGSASLRRATGELFARLAYDPDWLARRFDVTAPDMRRVIALSDLSRARLEAALLLATHEALGRGAGSSLLNEAAESVSAHTGADWSSSALLLVLPEPFEAATSLEARRLSGAMHLQLRERCNEDWWANPRSRTFLGSYFVSGGLYDLEEFERLHALEPVPWTSAWMEALG